MPEITCEVCGNNRYVSPSVLKFGNPRFCSRACEVASRTKHEIRVLNGVSYYLSSDGYYKSSAGVVHHRAVWEAENGPIPDGFHVHHINGNRSDNRIENLRCLKVSEHLSLHGSRTEEEDKRIIESYTRLRSTRRVAEEVGRSRGFIYTVLRERDIDMGPSPIGCSGKDNPSVKIRDVSEVFRLRATGMTQEEVARKLGVSQTAISYIERNRKDEAGLLKVKA